MEHYLTFFFQIFNKLCEALKTSNNNVSIFCDLKIIEKVKINILIFLQTCRTFLNGMVNRKRGHIVSISSIAGKITMARAVTYCTTKWAVRGFMSALYVELCADNCDKFVHLSTIYPSYINTRKELANLLNNSG